MTQCLVLTTMEAEAVRGETIPDHLLEPRQMSDGNWALPVSVLSDPAHELKWGLLKDRPQRSVTAEDFPAPEGIE